MTVPRLRTQENKPRNSSGTGSLLRPEEAVHIQSPKVGFGLLLPVNSVPSGKMDDEIAPVCRLFHSESTLDIELVERQIQVLSRLVQIRQNQFVSQRCQLGNDPAPYIAIAGSNQNSHAPLWSSGKLHSSPNQRLDGI
jgi:hypothetical protein